MGVWESTAGEAHGSARLGAWHWYALAVYLWIKFESVESRGKTSCLDTVNLFSSSSFLLYRLRISFLRVVCVD